MAKEVSIKKSFEKKVLAAKEVSDQRKEDPLYNILENNKIIEHFENNYQENFKNKVSRYA